MVRVSEGREGSQVKHLPAQRPRKCRCESCRFTASVFRIQRKLSRYDRSVIEKLLSKWAHESTDAAYYRMRYCEQAARAAK